MKIGEIITAEGSLLLNEGVIRQRLTSPILVTAQCRSVHIIIFTKLMNN